MEKFKILIIPLLIILAGILIALAIIFLPQINKKEGEVFSSQEVGEKILTYFNSYIPEEKGKAILIESKEESGVYRFKFKVAEEEFDTFASKDGKFLFIGFAELDQIVK